MMHTVHMILLLMFLTFSTLTNSNQAKKRKCKCKFELNLLTKLIENIEEDVTMLKVLYPYTQLIFIALYVSNSFIFRTSKVLLQIYRSVFVSFNINMYLTNVSSHEMFILFTYKKFNLAITQHLLFFFDIFHQANILKPKKQNIVENLIEENRNE